MIFVDSSAFFAILCAGDANYQRARACLKDLREEGVSLVTNNYVVVETLSLLQRRLGLDKVRDFQEIMLPLLTIEWVDDEQHHAAVRAVLQANRRRLSPVDCSAFETMRRLGVETIFTFDEDFRDQGFKVIP